MDGVKRGAVVHNIPSIMVVAVDVQDLLAFDA
jgi:hypothetical protein